MVVILTINYLNDSGLHWDNKIAYKMKEKELIGYQLLIKQISEITDLEQHETKTC